MNLALLLPAILAAAQAEPAGPSFQQNAAQQAAATFSELTIASADPQDSRRWVLWRDGKQDMQAVHLALRSRAGLSAPVDWRDGYGPTLHVLPEWRHAGQAVALVTVQFGAAAVEVAVYGIGPDDKPTRLDDGPLPR